MQIHPHFVFNALNAISSEVEADPVSARNMIEHLGSLLRLTLDTNDRQLVPLFEELSFLDHYLAIQRIRFGDRLRFELVIDEDVRHVPVPSMTIQPLSWGASMPTRWTFAPSSAFSNSTRRARR